MRMHTICIENKRILFSGDVPPDGSPYLRLAADEVLTPAKVRQKVENRNTLWLVSADSDAAFERFCSQFHVIEAAGGIVSTPEGRVLAIYRNNRWDLPKGHVEPGESTPEAALREVQEECGVGNLTLGQRLAVTSHFYFGYGEWQIKRCTWYAMHCPGCLPTKPQRQEGIERAEWLGGKELIEAMAGSYCTVQDAFAAWLRSEAR